MNKYGLTTSQRLYGTVKENLDGKGPCYLKTEGLTADEDEALLKAYLNMAPSQTLKWIESGKRPSQQNVEIEGTEPYVVGGHTASGYWVDTHRQTTIHGLYAAGDVAGGCPQKYVTGALVEGEIAAKHIVETALSDGLALTADEERQILADKVAEYNAFLGEERPFFTVEELEEAMQKVMDTYAGGIGSHYQYNERQLALADEKIDQLMDLADSVGAGDYHELLFVYELKERLTVCKVLIAHLRARKETRWHSFAENLDYPEQKDEWLKYVNSRMDEDGQIHMVYRDLVPGGSLYEHSH